MTSPATPFATPSGPADPPRPARYRLDHLTAYDYGGPVTQSWQLARITPRALPWQRLAWHRITVDPEPDERHDGEDAWGNRTLRIGLHRPHHRLAVRMQCEVEVGVRPVPRPSGLSWDQVRDRVRQDPRVDDLMPARLCEPSPHVPLLEAARRYATPALRPGRPWLDAVTALMRAIHRDFAFESGVTTTTTSVAEVLQHRRGVCQDFAHLMLACLRAHGLPARYVSGYLLTDPPPGQPRLLGADASHAWVAAWHPACGWVEFDPTNDQQADRRHVTLAWGADFADVVPLRGVILGGGTQALQVSVSVVPVDTPAPAEPGG